MHSVQQSSNLWSYYPPTACNDFLTNPFSRRINGRDVSERRSVAVTLMWTMTTLPKKALPNHFVLQNNARPATVDISTGSPHVDQPTFNYDEDFPLLSSPSSSVNCDDASANMESDDRINTSRFTSPNYSFSSSNSNTSIVLSTKY